jgi:hypothetical protein
LCGFIRYFALTILLLGWSFPCFSYPIFGAFFSNGLHDFTAEKKLEVSIRAGPIYQLATGRNFFVKTLGKSS